MTDSGQRPTAPRREPHSAAFLAAVALVLLALFAGFAALGAWQVERRAWKLDLMERVASRVHAPAVPAPGPDQWPQVNAADHAYRHVEVTGTFLHDSQTLVQATTALGGGYWVLTPLQQADGTLVLVNRGFVPAAARRAGVGVGGEGDPGSEAGQSEAPVTVTGLLRVSEPDGTFMRENDPEGDRWYSRDVEAIAAARGLENVAPYFIDADAAPGQATAPAPVPASTTTSAPVGGLTVVAFHNNHLVYALTWFALALMVLGVAWYVVRDERALRRQHGGASRADGTAAHERQED